MNIPWYIVGLLGCKTTTHGYTLDVLDMQRGYMGCHKIWRSTTVEHGTPMVTFRSWDITPTMVEYDPLKISGTTPRSRDEITWDA